MSENDCKSLPDERLIKMTKEPPSSSDHVKAAIELHKRQKKEMIRYILSRIQLEK